MNDVAQPTSSIHIAKLITPLPEGTLRLRRMRAHEELGRPFVYELELLADNPVRAADLLGEHVGIQLDLHGRGTRHWGGIVSRFARTGVAGRKLSYRATLRPSLWQLSRTQDCRIFQHMTVPDVIVQLFRERGVDDYELSLSQNYREWEYLVQYRETALDFCTRLMEQEGLYYYFKHEPGRHSLVLADSIAAHANAPGYEEVPYYPPELTERRERDYLDDWQVAEEITSDAYMLDDYEFTTPRADRKARLAASGTARHEVYDYPGGYEQATHGETYVRVRLEELQAQRVRFEGFGNARGLACGGLFKLIEHPETDQNRDYLITRAEYAIETTDHETGKQAKAEPAYRCSLVAIDSKVPYRLPRITPRPIVRGPQTALVVGKSGEDIWTDEHGRVKVQFPWDRRGANDENSSCWVRVAQLWAGGGFGAIHIPRIGQEVIVDFLEGDPNRPIVTGRVYNGDQMPPYELPANQTQSGVKSQSTPGGGVAESNELRFEDKKGEEEVFLHAQRNLTEMVEADHSLTVNGSQTYTVKGGQTVSVGGTQGVSVDGSRSLTVQQGETVMVSIQKTETVQGMKTEMVTGVRKLSVTGANTEVFSGGHTVIVTGIDNTNVTGDKVETVTGVYNASADSMLSMRSKESVLTLAEGNAMLFGPKYASLTSDEAVVVAGDKSLSLQVGEDSFIMITPEAITLQSKTIQIIGTDKVVNGVGKSNAVAVDSEGVNVSGKRIGSHAAGMHEITGVVVRIN